MAELKNGCPPESAAFKEAVCIDAGRVYDSCCDRDCLEDLRCFFTPEAQANVEQAISVRLRCAEVLKVDINVEPVSFNKGFYACDLTFFFLLDFDLYLSQNSCPVDARGITVFNKKVILYGSDGNVKTFSSSVTNRDDCYPSLAARRGGNAPRCVVQCVDPVVLSAHLGEIHDCYENICCCIPQQICDSIGGNIITSLASGSKAVFVTLGLFTIVQLIRNVQMLIPVYDFCIPEKECDCTTDQPCDVFRKIKFPTDDFFPPRPCNHTENYCGCSEKEED